MGSAPNPEQVVSELDWIELLDIYLVSEPPLQDFPGCAVDKSLPADAGDMGLIPGLWRLHMMQSN